MPVAEPAVEIVEKAANLLWSAQQNLRTCAPVRELVSGAGPDFAYQVQELNTKRRLADGARLVGRKDWAHFGGGAKAAGRRSA